MTTICKYKECQKHTYKTSKFCFFHQIEFQVTENEQTLELKAHISYSHQTYNTFDGFVFQHSFELDLKNVILYPLSFKGCTFKKKFVLKNGQVFYNIDFSESIFEDACVITKIKLLTPNTSIPINQFNFSGCKFLGWTSFSNCDFSETIVDFARIETKKYFQFLKCSMKKPNIILFNNAKIDCSFKALSNDPISINFENTEFSGPLEFSRNSLGNLSFSLCSFSEEAIIDFQGFNDSLLELENKRASDKKMDATIIQSGVKTINTGSLRDVSKKLSCISFWNCNFSKNRFFFKNFNFRKDSSKVLSFQHSDLNNSFFINCDFKNISLFSSNFRDIQIINCEWGKMNEFKYLPAKWGHINYLTQDEELKTKGSIADLTELKNIYAQFKAVFDNAKKYDIASEFYYNERNVHRLILKKEKRRFAWLVHNVYWLTTGYSQRPGRSIASFILLIMTYASYNMTNGIKKINGEKEVLKIIDYDLTFSPNFIFSHQFYIDLWDSINYALSRIIPFGFSRNFEFTFIPLSESSSIFFFNTTYSLLAIGLFTAILVGFKRQLKRF